MPPWYDVMTLQILDGYSLHRLRNLLPPTSISPPQTIQMSSPLVDQPSSPRTHASVPQSLDATADSQSIVKPSWTYSQNAAARSSSSSTMASPTLSPDWYPGSSTLGSGYFPLLRRPSATSARSLSSIEMAQAAMARSSSTMSIPMKEGDVEVVTEEGLGHVGSRLVAR